MIDRAVLACRLRGRLAALLGLWLLGCAPAAPAPPSKGPAQLPPAPSSQGAPTRGKSDNATASASAQGSGPPTVHGPGSAAQSPLAAGLRGFCVHGGAPLVGLPLVDESGRLYIVTQDGYLHSYEGDGRFRFSFTVAGTPLGSPSLRASDGAVLLGTTARSVYGIGSQGQLSFRAHTVTPVWSGLHARDSTSVVYVGLDRFLYALSNHGVALYRVPIPGQPVGEPAVAPGGVVYIPLDTGLARLEQAVSVRRFALGAPVDDLGLGARGPLVVSAGVVHSFDAQGAPAAHGAADILLADGRSVLALASSGGATWFEQGDPARRTALGAHDALTPSGRGGLLDRRALLPLATGEVALLDLTRLEAPVVRRARVLAEPLALATFTPRSRRILVAGRSGQTCLLDDPFGLARSPGSSR